MMIIIMIPQKAQPYDVSGAPSSRTLSPILYKPSPSTAIFVVICLFPQPPGFCFKEASVRDLIMGSNSAVSLIIASAAASPEKPRVSCERCVASAGQGLSSSARDLASWRAGRHRLCRMAQRLHLRLSWPEH